MTSNTGEPVDGKGWKSSIPIELWNALDAVLGGYAQGVCRGPFLIALLVVIPEGHFIFQRERKDMVVVQRRLIDGSIVALSAEIFSDGTLKRLHRLGDKMTACIGPPDKIFLADIFIDSYVILVGMLGCW